MTMTLDHHPSIHGDDATRSHPSTSAQGQLALDLPAPEVPGLDVMQDRALEHEPRIEPACSTEDVRYDAEIDPRDEPSLLSEGFIPASPRGPASAMAPRPQTAEAPTGNAAEAPTDRFLPPVAVADRTSVSPGPRRRTPPESAGPPAPKSLGRTCIDLSAPFARMMYPPADGSLELKTCVYEAIANGWQIIHGEIDERRVPLQDPELHGIMSKQPLLVMLAQLGSDLLGPSPRICVETFLRALVQQPTPNAAELQSSFYDMSRAVRTLDAATVSWLDEVIKLTPNPTDAEALAETLRSHDSNHADGEQKEAIAWIERAFSFMTGDRSPRPRANDDHATDRHTRASSRRPADETAPQDDWMGRVEPTPYIVGASRTKNRRNPIPVAVQRALNQQLVYDERHYLTHHDMVVLRDELLSEASPCRAGIAACLWGGLWAEDLTTWHAFADVASALTAPGWTVAMIPSPLAFLVVNGAQSSLPSFREVVAASHIYLPLHDDRPGADALKERAASRLNGPMFDAEDRHAVHARMHALRMGYKVGLTAASVQQQMAKALTALSGDSALSMMLKAKPIPTHTVQKASYRQWRLERVAQRFHDAGDLLETRLRKGTTHWGIQRTAFPRAPYPAALPPDALIGSLRCPSEAERRSMAKHLRRGIHKPPVGHPHPTRIIEFHRRFMAYTLTLLQWATGARPGQWSLDGLQSPVDDIVLLAEKATTAADRRHRKRSVRLSPVAMRQYGHWMSHRRFVMRALSLEHRSTPVFFDVDGHGRAIALTHEHYKTLANHPLCRRNAARHALASALIQHDLPATQLNALLGHALPGEEVAAPFHAGYPEVSDEALRLIDDHLEATGLRALAGYKGGD